jgi:hypothetical protein
MKNLKNEKNMKKISFFFLQGVEFFSSNLLFYFLMDCVGKLSLGDAGFFSPIFSTNFRQSFFGIF